MDLNKYSYSKNYLGDILRFDEEFKKRFENQNGAGYKSINYVGNYKKADEKSVAIIGSRKMTDYGKRVCEYIGGCLAAAGVTIVSGLMYGVDYCAHKSALASGGRTIAVLGYGLNYLQKISYAAELSQQIVSTDKGFVISEFQNDQNPQSWTFPKRNKLIAYLSEIIIVIEADEFSGSLITVDFALQQNKEVYAVPGSIFSPRSYGTNKLIKDGSNILLDPNEILQLMNIKHFESQEKNINIERLGEDERLLFELIKKLITDEKSVSVDLLFFESNIPISKINILLAKLEFHNIISINREGTITMRYP